jgi:branched-chain amino acid aminotransferase
MESIAYFNGNIVESKNVLISPYDLGLLRAYGVFDVMRTWSNRPFLLPEHYRRLRNSAKELSLRVPLSEKEFAAVVENLLRLNAFPESRIRTVLTGGPSPDGYAPTGKQTFFILIEEIVPLPDEVYVRGAKIITVDYHRERSHVKSTNYSAAMKHHKERVKKNALEILYVHEGKALEGSASNLFSVKKKRLITPKDDILPGITRNYIIRLAKKLKFGVEERAISVKELLKADEVFMTSTTKNIVPVVAIDSNRIGPGTVGPVTTQIMDCFIKYAGQQANQPDRIV